jgi:protease secretion system outer membrane protein
MRKTLICIALLALPTASFSMDLLQAYVAAKTQDASILASRAAADAGRERLPQAQAQLLPNISASVSTNNNHLQSISPNFFGQEQITDSNYKSGNQALTLRQPVFRTAIMAQMRQAESMVQDVEAILAQDEQNLVVRVCGAYFEAVLTDEQLALVMSQKLAYTTQLDAARKAIAAGSGTRTDVDDAQARLDMTIAQEIEARQNVDFTLRQLQALVNQPVQQLARLDVSRMQITNVNLGELDTWLTKAYQQNPQIKSLQAQLESARHDVDKANSGHHPTLDIVAQWTRSNSESVTNSANRNTNSAVGVQLNIPILAGGYVRSTVRQALANQERASQAAEAGRREIAVKVHKEYRGVTESVPKIKAFEQALRSADQLVMSSKKSFQAGSRTVLDVLNAEQQRMVVLRDLAQARYIYLISKIRLLALVGEADEDAIAQMNLLFQAG